ncbi:nicastrin [Sitophilus oryzae]|uniref:Nicastrin n=1 Tax=Sitophilus oryzae TaxID=7048 RepID=A0A6J2X9I8_SITOR|nr:nicastrin [Sitophilus oryzae]
MDHIKLIIILLYACLSIITGNGDRIKDMMFDGIDSSVPCYRRLNATHQIGCSSKRGGSTGVIHFCETIDDLQFILNSGTAGPYIPVLSTKIFSPDIVHNLSYSDKVSGLIVYTNEPVNFFSHDEKCPNNRFSVDGTCKNNGWNPWGTGLLYVDIPFPLFYVENENDTQKIKECFQTFNNFSFDTQKDRSLCSLELESFMFATTNTPTCQRRSNIVTNMNPVKLCDPLGDYNTWASLFPLVEGSDPNTKPINDFEYIIIAARSDTTSLFDKTTGAENPITSMVTLLSTAKLLKEMVGKWNNKIKKNILFILFTGETYDYIGSQRFLYDMELGLFPVDLPKNNTFLPIIYPENISLFIEISQLSYGKDVYVHYLEDNQKTVATFFNIMNSSTDSLFLHLVPNSLPPSSLHTFIRGNNSIQGMVITNHESEYINHYYNSFYDTSENIQYKYQNGSSIPNDSIQGNIGNIVTVLANSLYEEIIGTKYNGTATANLEMIDELFHCYLEDPSCKVHKAIRKVGMGGNILNLYIGVDIQDNILTDLIALTLAWFTGDLIEESGPNCTNIGKSHVFKYYNMSSNMDDLENKSCYRCTLNHTLAISPAFVIPDYDWSSNKYSSWSESAWRTIGVRIFLKPSPAHERSTIAIGSMIMVLAFVLTYFIKSRSNVLFPPEVFNDPPVNC